MDILKQSIVKYM